MYLGGAAAVDLHRRGAVLVEGNFDKPEQLQLACQNATAVFLNVSPSFRGDGAELRQATNVVCAARASGTVTTLVYSNVCAVGQRKEFPGWHDGTTVRGYFLELVESYTLRTAMAPEKRTMFLNPDDIGRFAAALVELEGFSRRAIEIGGETLTAEQVARAISEAKRLAPSNPQIHSQLWFWERQDGIEPRGLEAEFGFKLTIFNELLTTNQELVREAFE
ncbi:hypothetical protein N7501_006503 [Penicillium viridicatum]|nr:hypothetical protein N7501_006503 [Penicillium viridicatum]